MTLLFAAKLASLRRYWDYLYRLLLAIVLAGVSNFWGFSSPNGFVKCASIVSCEELPLLDPAATRYAFDIRALVESMPYQLGNVEDISIVDPDLRVELVTKQCLGNCANKSRALARILQKRGIPYTVVFIMHSANARSGEGHTVVECPITLDSKREIGLVDLLEGGVAMIDRRPMQVEDLLQHSSLTGARIYPLHTACDAESVFYGDFLADGAIGVSTSEEMNRYFDLMSRWYLPLGVPRLERAVFVAGAIVVGRYPAVYMTQSEIQRFDPWFRFEMVMARSMVWAIRTIVFMALVDLCWWGYTKLGSDSRGALQKPATNR